VCANVMCAVLSPAAAHDIAGRLDNCRESPLLPFLSLQDETTSLHGDTWWSCLLASLLPKCRP
jgi:hypothetical protein